ncbi:MAG TPA: hypothetical protein VHH52_07160, partial [Pseudonocardiaceae bacterium]|nr:hypothetical protein [Pseudonocardiaceae bacterium]
LENSTDQRQKLRSGACSHAVRTPTSPPGSRTGSPYSSGPGQTSRRRTCPPSNSSSVTGE